MIFVEQSEVTLISDELKMHDLNITNGTFQSVYDS